MYICILFIILINYNKLINNSKLESSYDIYDSFNTDEEKKNQLLNQIKNII